MNCLIKGRNKRIYKTLEVGDTIYFASRYWIMIRNDSTATWIMSRDSVTYTVWHTSQRTAYISSTLQSKDTAVYTAMTTAQKGLLTARTITGEYYTNTSSTIKSSGSSGTCYVWSLSKAEFDSYVSGKSYASMTNYVTYNYWWLRTAYLDNSRGTPFRPTCVLSGGFDAGDVVGSSSPSPCCNRPACQLNMSKCNLQWNSSNNYWTIE